MRSDLTFKDLIKALRLFDEALDLLHQEKPVVIRATGGFAMLAHGLREGGVTADIDTVTPTFDERVQLAMRAVAIKLDLPEDWLNNDLVYSASDTVDQDDVDAYDALVGGAYDPAVNKFKHVELYIADLELLARSKALACRDIMAGRSVKDANDLADILDMMNLGSVEEACREFAWLEDEDMAPVRSMLAAHYKHSGHMGSEDIEAAIKDGEHEALGPDDDCWISLSDHLNDLDALTETLWNRAGEDVAREFPER